MYQDYYGLIAKPFQLTPDPRFFFGSRGHNRALAYLRYGLSQSEGFIVITGDIGTGKTTLAQMLFDELPKEEFITARVVTTQLSAHDTLRMVANAFNIRSGNAGKATLLSRIEAFLENEMRKSRRVLLVVDEAQNLPQQALEELRMLSNFTVNGGRPGLQSFLLGQVEFREMLQSAQLEQFRQRIIAACHLVPLRREEVRSYIEHRLKLAGWTDNPQLDEGIFDAIFEVTRGIPRRINTLFDRVLLFGYLEECRVIDQAAVQTVAEELRSELPSNSALTERQEFRQDADAGVLSEDGFVSLGDLDRRIIALENRIQSMSSSLNKVMAYLRCTSRNRQPADSD